MFSHLNLCIITLSCKSLIYFFGMRKARRKEEDQGRNKEKEGGREGKKRKERKKKQPKSKLQIFF